MKLYNLFNRKVFHIEPGLERIKKACEEIKNPQNNFESILISGTNGKGSVASYLESLFRKHGYKTGLFTSPHLVDENERWQINRKKIPDSTLEEYIKDLKPVIRKYNLTYFEASTLIAFKYFSDEGVDIAVLEVGLGGRWDATNIVEPEISVITNVSFDHIHLLGNSLEEIAREKLGIARKKRPLIIGSNQMEIISQAILKGIKEIYHYPINFYYKKIKTNMFGYFFKNYKLKDLEISMLGDRQVHNASTALTAFFVFLEKKKLNPDINAVKQALKENSWPGRMELIERNPPVVLDGAHNEEAVLKTLNEITALYPDRKLFIVYTGMKDKNWKKIVNILSQKGEVLFTELSVSRGLKKEDFIKEGFNNVICDPLKAVNEAKEKAKKEKGVVLITGSLYLVGEVLKVLKV
jgi:dihydrofolate synthase/folylpolyglutamate synthase